MLIHFSKYHGTGNDFIIIDNRDNQFSPDTDIIKNLCDRHFGIGADGLMLLELNKDSDFKMRYFNSDGNEASMCGNGGRCIVLFAYKLGIIGKITRFAGVDGFHSASIDDDKTISLHMKDVDEIECDDHHYLINTGSPHYINFVESASRIDVSSEGRLIRNSFSPDTGGVNVNFVQLIPEGIFVRTYERGVEAETLSCGTGAVASAIATEHWLDEGKTHYNVKTNGGVLGVSFQKKSDNQYHNIWLRGPAVHVFDGNIGY